MSDDNKAPAAEEASNAEAETAETNAPEASTDETATAADGAERGSAAKLEAFDAPGAKEADAPKDAEDTTSDETIAADLADEKAEAPESVEAADPAPADDLSETVARLTAEKAQLTDQLMRAVADVQNARKRAERDRRDAETYGGTKLARDLLAVYDNLSQALTLASDELKTNEAGFFNGVELTQKELINAFAKHNIQQVSPEIGEKFDPNRHQAMYEAPAPGAEAGTVIQVMQDGFMIADRLLRPAMVGVAKGGGAAPQAADETASA